MFDLFFSASQPVLIGLPAQPKIEIIKMGIEKQIRIFLFISCSPIGLTERERQSHGL
jgi:hypothetical protein